MCSVCLRAGQHDLDGTPHLAGCHRREDLVRPDIALAAEATAEKRGAHLYVLRGYAERGLPPPYARAQIHGVESYSVSFPWCHTTIVADGSSGL